MKNFKTIISMMSGTSIDSIDACLVKIFDDLTFEVIDGYSLEYPQEIREKGRTYYVPKEYKVNLSTDSVLSAYNAIKDSDITVDLTESKNSLNNIRSGKLMI